MRRPRAADLVGAVTSSQIAASAVGATQIASGAVTEPKLAANAVSQGQMKIFFSSQQTGTGSPQNIAHGLGETPAVVLIVWEGTGTFTAVQGTHTSTNVVVTVANTATYRVLAIAP